jgi:hypothetical protein
VCDYNYSCESKCYSLYLRTINAFGTPFCHLGMILTRRPNIMKKVYTILIALFISLTGFSQPCLPGGIIFTTQAQIDSFQTNYPNCTEVEGNLYINNLWHGTDITNLDGLIGLTSIGGTLLIETNNYLVSITGLINLHSVGGALYIEENNALTSLTGLDSLNSVGGLVISWNEGLTNLTGLENLYSINGDFIFEFNHHLANLTGFDNLTSIEGKVRINNNNLINFIGLESLNCIGGSMDIHHCYGLISLTGLDNLTSIGGYLHFFSNNSLINLIGLNNLKSIGGYLEIVGNGGLISLTGLESLDSIGGELKIGMNGALTSLEALSNLKMIGGNLVVFQENSLTSLTGLDNIDAESIIDLYLTDNLSLSTCDIQSVCDYLSNPNGVILLYGNSDGCASQQEVETACGVGIDGYSISASQITIYPNPSATIISIALSFTTPVNNTVLSIVNINSQQVIARSLIEPVTVLDISTLPRGVYFALVTTEKTVMVGKFVKTVVP